VISRKENAVTLGRTICKMKRNLVVSLALFFTGITGSAFGSIINASSCSQTAVQSAINSAAAGDRVMVPAGTCTWTASGGNPSVLINKAITVQGATSCTGTAANLSCTDSTVILDGTGTGDGEIPFLIGVSGVRLTGFSFTGGSGTDYKSTVQTASNTTNWRIDHNHFYPSNGVRGIAAAGFGLIDHNHFVNAGDGVAPVGDDSRDGGMYGNYNWSQPLNPGSVNAIYMEDNKFVYSQVMDGAYDAYSGARLVFRYNYVSGTTIGSHGLDSTDASRSTLLEEIYGNTSSANFWTFWNSRGGVYFIFDNTATNYDTFIDLRNYRQANGFNFGNGNPCDGSNYIDGNTSGGQGYPCRDQVGRGPETAPANDWPAKTSSPVYSEGRNPGYSWNNTLNGKTPTVASNFNISNALNVSMPNIVSQYHIIENRDFFNEVSNFIGTAGVGRGLLSARPSTCSNATYPGPAYWATDTNTLYVCSAANTWSVYYKPYTYPHPLQQSDGPNPPTSVKATVQ
jgi:hypothetical protein